MACKNQFKKIEIFDIPKEFIEEFLIIYLENKYKCFGQFSSIDFNPLLGRAVISTNNVTVADQIIQHKSFELDGNTFQTREFVSNEHEQTIKNPCPALKTVQLVGNFETKNKMLELYVESPRNNGGPVDYCNFEIHEPWVTFKNAEVARAFASQDHVCQDVRFKAVLIEGWPKPDACCAIEIGISERMSEKMFEETLKIILENYRQGGRDKCIEDIFIKDPQKAVVTFESHEDVKNIMKKTNGTIDLSYTLTLTPFKSAKPPIYVENPDNKKLIFLELNHSSLVHRTNLENFITKISKASVCRFYFCPKPDRVLVQFETEPDYSHVLNVLCCKPFEGSMISVQRLAKVNKIQVCGWMYSKEMLVYYLESRVKDVRGSVKDVYNHEGNIFIVTFENAEVTERILSKSRYEYCGNCFNISPYIEEFGIIPENFDPQSPPSLIPKSIVIPIKRQIYGFLLENETYKESFVDVLSTLHCKIEWPFSLSNLNVTLSWKGGPGQLENSKCWPEEVTKCFHNELNKYDHFECELDDSVFDFVECDVRKYKPGRDKLLKKIDSKVIGGVGIKKYVQYLNEIISCNIIRANNAKEKLIKFQDYQYFLVTNSPSFKNIAKKCDVRVSENKGDCTMLLVGQVEALNECSVELEGLKGKIDHDDLDWLGKNQDFLDLFTQEEEALKIVQNEFRSKNILAVLSVQRGKLSIYSFFDIDKGITCLQNMFTVSDMKLESSEQEAMRINEWNLFKNKLSKRFSNNVRLSVSANSDTIEVLSFSKHSQQIMKELEDYFKDYSKVTQQLKKSTAIVKLLKDLDELNYIKIDAKTKGVEIKIDLGPGDQSGFQLFGERSKLDSIRDAIELLCSKIVVKSFLMDKKIRNLFTPQASNVLRGIISNNKVYIDPNISKSSVGVTSVEHKNMKLPCRINITLGSIADQKTDIIFNCCSHNLQLSQSKVSKALLGRAGHQLQGDLQKAGSKLLPGEIVETSGHALKCSKVYHGYIVPWYKGEDECSKTIRMLIRNSLEKASRDKMTSISFPAFGTGNRGVPYQLAAHIMIKGAVSFAEEPSSLEEINFVIFEVEILEAYQAELKSYSIDATSPGADDDDDDDTVMKANKISLKVLNRDMLDERCDAIVNSTNINFEGGGMSRAIMEKAGDQVIKECKKLGTLTQGIAVTGSGNMSNCKHIFYASGRSFAEWQVTISNILNTANEMGLKTISMPLLGTGQKRVTVGEIAEIFLTCITEFSKTQNPSLATIKIMIPSSSMYSEFKSSVRDVKNRRDSNSSDRHGNEKNVEIEIYGLSTENVVEAHKALLEECKKIVTETDIPHNLEHLTMGHFSEVFKKYNVTIKMSQNFIKISGTSDISETINDVNEILKKRMSEEFYLNQLKDFSKYVTWSYFDGNGKIVNYGTLSTGKLESSYEKKESSLRFTDKNKHSHFVDFKTMTDVINNTDKFRIKRTIKDSLILPDHWDNVPESAIVELATLSATSNEYLEVQKLFYLGSLKPAIVKIERIQNPSLYRQYQCKKSDMEAKNKLKEVRAWHGTNPANVPNINTHNFNRAMSNQGSYGFGCYFAVGSDYSIQSYCSKGADGLRTIYLAKVLVGKVTVGAAMLKEPPIMDVSTGNRFDSVTDNLNSPSMYVIFYDCQMYPEYLITFQ